MINILARSETTTLRVRRALRSLADAASGPVTWLLIGAVLVWGALGNMQLFVVGVIVGSILALGAIGLTLIYGILKFGNFAHGDTMMLGAYIAFFFLTGRVVGERRDVELPWSLGSLPGALERIGDLTFGYGLILAAILAGAAVGLLSVGLDRLIYRPLRRRNAGIVIFAVASLGLAIALRSVMLILWGPDPRVYVPGVHLAKRYDLGFTTVALKSDQIFMLGMAVFLTALIYLLLFRTKLGKAMRAMADNPDLALVSGINTEQVVVWTWVIGGALVAVAGVLLALQAQLNPNLGFFLLLPLFASAILGGIGSPHGALIGAMIVGITQEVSVGLEFSIGGAEILPLSPGYKFSVATVILILILLLRPRGLFGAKT